MRCLLYCVLTIYNVMINVTEINKTKVGQYITNDGYNNNTIILVSYK